MTIQLDDLVLGYRHDLNPPLSAIWGDGTIAITAGNGGGKSTLLRTLLGLVRPRAGRVRVAGHDPMHQPLLVRQRCGYMPDALGLPAETPVQEIIALACWAHRVPLAHGSALAASFGVTAWWHQALGSCSLGQQRRAALAAAVVSDPPIMLLDEPTVGLDAAATHQLVTLMRERARNGRLTVVATHDQSLIQAVAAGVLRLQSVTQATG